MFGKTIVFAIVLLVEHENGFFGYASKPRLIPTYLRLIPVLSQTCPRLIPTLSQEFVVTSDKNVFRDRRDNLFPSRVWEVLGLRKRAGPLVGVIPQAIESAPESQMVLQPHIPKGVCCFLFTANAWDKLGISWDKLG